MKVTLSADPERQVTIPLSATNQGGASNSDYSGVPANVTFESGETSKSFTFSAVADSDNDDGESVALAFGTLPANVTAGSTNETTVSITDDDDPSVTASFEQASYSVTEGGTVDVKVTLNADPERTVTIPLSATNQGGATSADYSGVPADVTFESGETSKSFTFSAVADSDNDDGESVKIAFGTLPTGVSAGSTAEATVSITDDDVPTVTVSFGQGMYTAAEGGTVNITVTLDADPERQVVIPISKANQGGASNSDYSGVPANVTFESGETEQSFTFTATSDSDNDDGESVKLTFGTTLPDGVSAGSANEAVVSITDDDVPAVEVSFGSSTYTVDEGEDVTVTVTVSADPERTLIIPVSKTEQGGASNADYSGVPANVTFESGGYGAEHHVQRGHRQRQRRRGVGEAGLRESADGRERGQHERGHRVHHRRRHALRNGEFRAGDVHGGRGEHGGGHGDVECRPRAAGGHPDQQDEPGRGIRRRLHRRTGERDLRERGHGAEHHVQRSLRQRQRRRGVGEAGLRESADGRERGQHERGRGLDHRRRRAHRDS